MATAELLAQTYIVHVHRDLGDDVRISCNAVLRLERGRGWADCTTDYVDARAEVLPGGRAAFTFSTPSWSIRCEGAFTGQQVSQGVASGVGYAGYDGTICSAEIWP